VPKFSVLRLARMQNQPFRPVEVTDIDAKYHVFIVRYSGDYIPNAHAADEFVYIIEGAITMEIEKQKLEVRQGEAVMIPAGTQHRPRCKNSALALIMEKKGLQRQMDNDADKKDLAKKSADKKSAEKSAVEKKNSDKKG
jgi:mannose-6-phosphate isomerase-like protein (cupin superfamily)